MRYLKLFENYKKETLIIVDVQKSFRKFFTEMYLHELKKYCNQFDSVYQIWDNHVDGKFPEKDYLYEEEPEIPIHKDLYHFPNQKDIIEKRYNYDVDVDFYKQILDVYVYKSIKEKEENSELQKGDIFETKIGTAIVYIGNNHKWFQVPKKLFNILNELKGEEITIVGGSDSECLEDIVTTAETLGLKVKRDHKFIYSASHCPIS